MFFIEVDEYILLEEYRDVIFIYDIFIFMNMNFNKIKK